MAFSETVPGGEVGRVGCQDFAVLTAGVLPALLVHRLLRQEQSAVDTPEFTQHLTRAAGDQRTVALGLRCGIRAPEEDLAELEVSMGELRIGTGGCPELAGGPRDVPDAPPIGESDLEPTRENFREKLCTVGAVECDRSPAFGGREGKAPVPRRVRRDPEPLTGRRRAVGALGEEATAWHPSELQGNCQG